MVSFKEAVTQASSCKIECSRAEYTVYWCRYTSNNNNPPFPLDYCMFVSQIEDIVKQKNNFHKLQSPK